jgi:hypothetical protein
MALVGISQLMLNFNHWNYCFHVDGIGSTKGLNASTLNPIYIYIYIYIYKTNPSLINSLINQFKSQI